MNISCIKELYSFLLGSTIQIIIELTSLPVSWEISQEA